MTKNYNKYQNLNKILQKCHLIIFKDFIHILIIIKYNLHLMTKKLLKNLFLENYSKKFFTIILHLN